MPKVKTRKSILKRFKVTGKGKILRGHQNAGHRKSHKTKKTIARFSKKIQLSKRQEKWVKSFIGHK